MVRLYQSFAKKNPDGLGKNSKTTIVKVMRQSSRCFDEMTLLERKLFSSSLITAMKPALDLLAFLKYSSASPRACLSKALIEHFSGRKTSGAAELREFRFFRAIWKANTIGPFSGNRHHDSWAEISL